MRSQWVPGGRVKLYPLCACDEIKSCSSLVSYKDILCVSYNWEVGTEDGFDQRI